MDDPVDGDVNKHAATWVTAAVLASLAAPVLAKADARVATASSVSGPVAGYTTSEGYVRLVTRATYFWAWPMVNVYNRLLAMQQVPQAGLNGGIVPVAPPNHLSMLRDYIEPQERFVACPNQDVVYGSAILDLDQSAVVVQVPDFGNRFWVYQAADGRTDGFATLGKMYGTKPGFYLFVGPHWNGKVPRGIRQVFHASTRVGSFIPRLFLDNTPEDREGVQRVINRIDLYPVADYDGNMKTHDWAMLPKFPSTASGSAEIQWVDPNKFFDELPAVLDAVTPLAGEQAIYTQARALLAIVGHDPQLKAAAVDEAVKTEHELIAPLFDFNTFGQRLPANWNTITNGARFGTDYYTRTAVARSNIFVNQPDETKYFYLDLDAKGQRLNGKNAYVVTFPKGKLPPVRGFWSLTLYNAHHFFSPNEQKRYSLGTKNKDLRLGDDGTLTLYIQSTPPTDERRANWLPAPADDDFSLYIRAYWPEQPVLDGRWTPPAVTPAQ
jgi:hypothetical protein